ncbi:MULTISPECIES: hypothetical protein [unclassified Nocardia]|uniref:hypothetical protein n=1 Tax=unclassified Nocardia TaxID=2637762 RepID=UPI001CE4A024|nr:MULTISPECIES: hypothetical protein [unclassified Nocardia]
MTFASSILDLSLTSPPDNYRSHEVSILADEIGTKGLRSWLQDNVIFLVLLLIVVAISLGAMKGNLSKVVTVGGLTLVALTFMVLATSENAAVAVGRFLLGLVGINA